MTVSSWPLVRWIAAVGGMIGSALVIAVPTGIVVTPWYVRMTPVQWWNYPVWVATAVLSGLIVATYVRSEARPSSSSRVGLGGNVLSLLAVGCPVCNKLVVMAVGASGALNLWAPVQPVLGVVSLVLLGWALQRRLAGERACAVVSTSIVAPSLR